MLKKIIYLLLLANFICPLIILPKHVKERRIERRLSIDDSLSKMNDSLTSITESCNDLNLEKDEFKKQLNNNLDIMLNEVKSMEPEIEHEGE